MSGLAHLDLDVLFGRTEGGYRVQILRSPAGDGQSVTFARPFTDLELENFVLKVGRFRARTRIVEPAPVAAAKLFGGKLFDAVFTGPVGECLRRSLDRAQQEQAALRIRLRLSDCSELANLPWELLYDRSDNWFLALSDHTPVVRYVQLPVQPRAVHVTLPLRVLVIRSEPLDYPQLDLEAEWAQVAAALGELTDAGALVFTELAAPTLGELRRVLLRDTFHVLHYMGHGGFDQQRGGVLMFTDRAGRGRPVTAGDLGVLLHDHTSMRLAVLNACQAGRTDPADPFAGVADTLVRRGIPAVIAMQFEVSDDAAIEFAPALYGAVAAGRPVDAAVAEARKAMYTISPLEWATPVLYLRADDAQLFDIIQHMLPRTSTAATRVEEGDRLCKQGLFADAEAVYRTAVALDPVLAPAYAGLGDALYRLKRYPEAEAACREAIRLDPALAIAHSTLGAVLSDLKRYRQPPAVPPRRKIMILMLGFKGSGKTLMLAALYQCFKLGGEPGITLIPDDASERKLSEITKNIQDIDTPYLPESTGRGETTEWAFSVRVDWEHAHANAFELVYLDYPGEHAEELLAVNPRKAPDERFLGALADADILMGVVDGGKIRKLMVDGYDARLVTEIEFILRRLILAEQKSIHLVISKWDLLVDNQHGRHYTMDEVVSKLESLSRPFRDFRLNPRFSSLRIIPMAALGTGFVRPSPDGTSMIKVPDGQWNPEDVKVPFFCSIPDIIKNDVARMMAYAEGTKGRAAMRSRLPGQLSWATIATLTIANIAPNITTHGFAVAIPFSKIIGRIREALDKRQHAEKPKRHDPDEALARVLSVSYANVDVYEQQRRFASPHTQQGR